ncbi:MAG: 2-amino-4-hydroxy-6-hydroxymethyldihydropteridine diphosphokinase [Chitinophagaceae bacterium]|nr:2-amino-4-hydroxy-6-hydroxymethyldihydropteridine diphosphokinase [Chitinophagaceae bacterium]
MNTAFLLIGGNIGDRSVNLQLAKSRLQQHIGEIGKCSSVYETSAWGNQEQADFLNQVITLHTKLSAAECMKEILTIENKMGRVRDQKNDPRIIDIDILFFDEAIINEPDLIIPHPQIQNRKFALIPMNELAPEFEHPVFNISIAALLSTCTDQLEVRLLK